MTIDQQQESSNNNDKQPLGRWGWFKRILTIGFFILVPILLFMLIKKVDWQEVGEALKHLKPMQLLIGMAIAFCSYCVFSSYDVLGRKYTGHSLPVQQVLPVAFVCYAFNLNLSSWVGGIALRFRLYSRLGLETAMITKIFTFSVMTNWLGYMLLAGIIFSSRLLTLPENWHLGTTGLQLLGVVLLAICAAYLAACQFARRRSWEVRGHTIDLPSAQMAVSQMVLAALNWSLMALLVYTLLPPKIAFPAVLGTLLISSIAGVIFHIPAGLGVLETVFITLLHHQLSKGTILAALIGYRFIYFLMPLAIATLVYIVLEGRAKKMRENNQAEGGAEKQPTG